MSVEQIHKIAVIGAGLMGHGIALELAAHGYPVSLYDLNDEILARAMQNVRRNLKLLADNGLLTAQQAEEAPSRIAPSADLERAAGDADLVIEAVAEKLEVKHDVFRRLDAICPPHTLLASNSSTLMPSQLAPATRRPERVLVAHYWNPPFLLPLVEIVGGPQTALESLEAVRRLMLQIGKTPVVMKKEAPGFIGNRLQFALLREALSIVEKGLATPEEVDMVVRSSFGRRLAVVGPFETFEVGGYDILYGAASYLFPDLDNSTTPPESLRRQVERGDLGIKTGKGIYTWTPETAEALRKRINDALILSAQRARSNRRD
jgi:3-hydroxybutyryl-CoA dehydrogenase